MAARLRDCPLCGAKAIIFRIPKNTKAELAQHPNWKWNNPGRYAIGCTGSSSCMNNVNHCSMIFATREEAATMWNNIADKVKPNNRRKKNEKD